MTEQELLDQIRETAGREAIPDALAPERIASRLKENEKARRVLHFQPKRAFGAAAVLLLCGMLSAAAWGTGRISPEQKADVREGNLTADASPMGAESGGNPQSVPAGAEQVTETEKPIDVPSAEPKKNAGTLYRIAENYNEVYHILTSSYEITSGYRAEAAAGETAEMQADGAQEKEMAKAGSDDAAARKQMDVQNTVYSTTNLQTQGVDESDCVKTDGRYIYTVTGTGLNITDTAGETMKPAGVIEPELGASDSVLEFYVDQNRLFLLVQCYDTSIQDTYYPVEDKDSGIIQVEDCGKISSIGTNAFTVLYTYDITDPASPSLLGTVEQDGYYYSSRKIGDIVYLFTRQGLESGDFNNFIPCVNGEKIPCGNIYISDEGREGFLISSVSGNEPDKTVDQVMLVHNFVNVYVAEDAVYLYHTDVRSADLLTQIAKFSIEDGIINAVNAASVKGEIYDTFAINAYRDTLRVLTTFYDRQGNPENRLYLLDNELVLTGSLEGIARGERIYAARYFGNTAYFVTYKNTDPLFAADLTDTANPVLLGELKISGFSEYLHFWGEDRLLGIGCETDPDSGEQKGVKLVLFDISDPTDLKAVDSLVLEGSTYSPALYDYQCVLADPIQNLIGFAAEYRPHDGGSYAAYEVYSFTDGRFVPRLSEKLPEQQNCSYDSVRGIYIGDTFFIADPTQITSFRMKEGFAQSGHLDLK